MEKINLKRSDGWRVALLILLALMYLSPGTTLLLEGRHDQVLSDGSDPATLPYSYAILVEHLKSAPSNLLFGAVPTDRLNPPEGFSLWFPWIEKFAVSIGGPFVALEQLSTFFTLILLILNGVSFYLMARVRGWGQGISLTLAICWAFNPFTRARAKVHMALAGIYLLPLVVLGLDLAIKRKSKRSLLAAAVCLLGAAMSAHYYIIMLAFLTPFFLIYVALQEKFREQIKIIGTRILIAATPAVFLVAWSFFKPLPSSWIKPNTITHIKTGETENGQRHPFLSRFAARPIDFFTGEIAIGLSDINPIRRQFGESVLTNIGDGNSHERSNGIRWLIWLAFGASLWLLLQTQWKSLWSANERRQMWLFVGFSAFCFWMAMDPDLLPLPSPSVWLAKLVSQYRVPSRAGVFALFGLLMVVGFFLHAWLERAPTKKSKSTLPPLVLWPKLKSKLLLSGLLPLLAVIELPPFLNQMPISPVSAVRADLADGKPCGYGLYYPYVSGTWALLEYYYFLQSMRASQCKIINAVADTVSDRNRRLMNTMPLHEKYLSFVQQSPQAAQAQLIQFAQCLPMDWLVFDKRISPAFMKDVCSALGFEITSADTCRSKERARPVSQTPESCLR